MRPRLKGKEREIRSLLEVHTSDFQIFSQIVGEKVSHYGTYTTALLASFYWSRFALNRMKTRQMDRREAIRALLAAAAIPVTYFASGAFKRLRNRESFIAGMQRGGRGTEIGKEAIEGTEEFRLTVAHELFHLIGRLGIMPKHALYADTYAILRANDSTDMESTGWRTPWQHFGMNISKEVVSVSDAQAQIVQAVEIASKTKPGSFNWDALTEEGDPRLYAFQNAMGGFLLSIEGLSGKSAKLQKARYQTLAGLANYGSIDDAFVDPERKIWEPDFPHALNTETSLQFAFLMQKRASIRESRESVWRFLPLILIGTLSGSLSFIISLAGKRPDRSARAMAFTMAGIAGTVFFRQELFWPDRADKIMISAFMGLLSGLTLYLGLKALERRGWREKSSA